MPDEPHRFDPQSTDAMFARILAENAADRERREEFRAQILARFDAGDARMDAQDVMLGEIRAETRKTNGRVTRLEGHWKTVAAKIAGAATALYAIGQIVLYALEKGWIRLGN